MTPTGLTVERLTDPIHVWTDTPRFGWRIPEGSASQQVAYEIDVHTADGGTLVTATGRIESGASHSVIISGLTLTERTAYRWRIRTWTGTEKPSEWATGSFETTILTTSAWKASWVEPVQQHVTAEPELDLMAGPSAGSVPVSSVQERLHPSPLLRQRFDLDHLPARARLYITARGVYEVTVNGQAITDEVLAPGYDEYQKRLSFQTYDAAPALRVGENVIGVRLADGWWAGRISFVGSSANYGDRLGVLWQLEGDGHVISYSDDSGRSSSAETRYADIFIGEKTDSRLAISGWDEPGFDDNSWEQALLSTNDSLDQLVPFIGEPVRRVQKITEPAILTTPIGETIVDLGQNIAGRLRLTATGPAGTEITLEHTESLDRDGNFQQNIMGRNKDQTDVWILAGTGTETWEPRFTYHGFRYVRVTGFPGDLYPANVVGIVIASDLAQTGTFTTDDPRINQLHSNVVWSQRGNFLSIPTDCPQRERAGWTGDVLVFNRASTNNARVDLFFDRWLANVRAAQSDDGIVPTIVPWTPSFAEAMSPFGATVSSGWGDVIIDLPATLYERYGDDRVLSENYEAMKKWVGWVREQAETHTLEQYQDLPLEDPARRRQTMLWNTGHHFGDWLIPSTLTEDETSMRVAAELTGALVGSAFYAHSTRTLARIAGILGDHSTAEELNALADDIRQAFVEEYLRPDGRLTTHLQGTYVIALAFDLIPAGQRVATGQHLVQLISDNGNHLDTGFLSVPHLLDVLVSLGESKLAYTLLFQDTVPSWLYEVDMGATTMWESWGGVEPDGQPRALSLNHYAFGAVDDWLYTHVAGIRPGSPGYSEIIFTPDLRAPFDAVNAMIDTPYGPVGMNWANVGKLETEITVTIPGNVTATLQLDGRAPLTVPPTGFTVRTTRTRELPNAGR